MSDTTKEEEPTQSDKAKSVETKDRWTILTLRVRGHVPLKIVPTAVGNNRVLVYHFPRTAWTDYDSYMRGEAIPVEDIRIVEAAEREFKNNLYRFAQR
jgi:hypothetical protein